MDPFVILETSVDRPRSCPAASRRLSVAIEQRRRRSVGDDASFASFASSRAVWFAPRRPPKNAFENAAVSRLISHAGQGQGTPHRFSIYGWRLEILRAGFVTDTPLPALVANNNC